MPRGPRGSVSSRSWRWYLAIMSARIFFWRSLEGCQSGCGPRGRVRILLLIAHLPCAFRARRALVGIGVDAAADAHDQNATLPDPSPDGSFAGPEWRRLENYSEQAVDVYQFSQGFFGPRREFNLLIHRPLEPNRN